MDHAGPGPGPGRHPGITGGRLFDRSNRYQEEVQKKRKSGGSEDEKMLRKKDGMGAFDLRQTLQEAIDTLQRKADKTKHPGN